MKRFVCIALLVSLWSISALAAEEAKKVAVLNFDFSGVQRWWDAPNWDIGAGISDLIVKHLVRDGRYRVMDRRALDAVLAEQNLSVSDRANPSTAAQIGRLLSVDAIIVGSITQFGTEKKKRGFGGIGGTFGGIVGGKVGTEKGKAKVAIDARIINIDTSEIMAVADGEGESDRSGFMLGGLGIGGGGFGAAQIDMGSSDFRETILGEAVHKAVEDLSVELIDAHDKVPTRKIEIDGLIAYVEGGLVIVNVGSNHGLSEGDVLTVSRVTREIKDPVSGKVLRRMTDTLGKIRITGVEEASAEAVVLEGSGFKIGDTVTN